MQDETSPLHFQIEARFLNAPDAHLLPAGDGHGFDDGGLGGGVGGVLVDERGEKFLEAILGFTVQYHGLSQHSVAGAAAGGDFLTFF